MKDLEGPNRDSRVLARPKQAFVILLHSSGFFYDGLIPSPVRPAAMDGCAEQQVLGASVLRAATFYYNWRFYGMAAAEKQRKENSSAAAATST